MMSKFVTGLMLAELIRRECVEPAPGEPMKTVTLNLVAVDDGVSRARASAVFNLSFDLSWKIDQFVLVDKRGYPVSWKFAYVNSWLEKSLSGQQSGLIVQVDNAAKLPARWTAKRIDSINEKLQAESGDAMRNEAAAKRASVSTWADGIRRRAVLAAADAMDDCADSLGRLQSWDTVGENV